MTGLERVKAAMSGQAADRRAWTAVFSLYGARLRGVRPERQYRDPRLFAEGQEAVVERFEPDILFSPFALSLEAEAYGAELIWMDKAPPNVRRPRELRAAATLLPLRPEDSPALSYLIESTRLVVERSGGERPVAGIIVAPIDLPALLFGIDAWLQTLLFDRALAEALLEFSMAHFSALARGFFAAGASFLASPVMFVNRRIINTTQLEDLLLPAIGKSFAGAGGPIVFHHGAIPIADQLSVLKDLPGVAGFVVDERDNLASVREILGPERLVLGGFSGPNMERRSPERIRELVEAALFDRRDDPRFILSSCAADLPWDTPEANIDVVVSAVAGARLR